MLHALSAQEDRTRRPALKDAAARVAVCGERGGKNSLPWTRFVCCVGAPGAPNVDKSASQVPWSTIYRYHGQIARVCWRLEYRYYEVWLTRESVVRKHESKETIENAAGYRRD
jgi:hypothetical protein